MMMMIENYKAGDFHLTSEVNVTQNTLLVSGLINLKRRDFTVAATADVFVCSSVAEEF